MSIWLSLLLVTFLVGVTFQPHFVSARPKNTHDATTTTNPQKTYWIKTYGRKGNESITAVKTLPNGDIIAVGHVYSSRGYLALVIKLTPNGDVIWTKTFGGEGLNETATSLAVASNGDVVVAGAVWSSNGWVCWLLSSHRTAVLVDRESTAV